MPKVALAQFSGDINKERNVEKAASLAREAAAQGAQVVCFPEICNTIYFCFENNPEYREWAEPISGPSVSRMREVARQNEQVLVFPFYENDEGTLYNTAAVIGPDGELIGKYRKNHIPAIMRTMTPGETPGDEKYYFAPGNLGFPVFKTSFGITIGIVICYDRHFPEGPRALGLQGAHMLLVPTATYRPWIRDVWEAELRGHAIANVMYVGGVNKVGKDISGPENRSYFGSAVFFGPDGRLLVRASDDHDEVVTTDVDVARLEDLRDVWGFYRDRRPDAYGLLTDQSGAAAVGARQ